MDYFKIDELVANHSNSSHLIRNEQKSRNHGKYKTFDGALKTLSHDNLESFTNINI